MVRTALYLLAVLAVAGWAACWWMSAQADRTTLSDLSPVLRGMGFREVERGRVDRPEGLPESAKPVGRFRGRVQFGPMSGPVVEGSLPDGGSSTGYPPPEATGPVSCPITPNDLAGGCDTQLIELAGKPWARVYWDGMVRLPDGSIVRRGPELAESLELRLDRAVDVERPRRFALGPRRPADWRVGWTAGVGVGVTPQGDLEAVAAVLYGVQF